MTPARVPPDSPLRVGLIAPPWVPVPPPVYGGTELVIDNLARGLVAAGHEVLLFTTGDSICPVPRRSVYPEALSTTGDLLSELRHVQAAYEDLRAMDVIHDHTLIGPLWAIAQKSGTPVVTTSHGPFTAALTSYYETIGEHVSIVAISHHQRSTGPGVPIADVIHHGIEVDRFPMGEGEGGYVLFLGRMNREKGAHRAIRVARAAGKRILLAAKMWEPAEHHYFHEFVEPLLDDDAVYVGEVGGQSKLDLLAGAEALVNPICWPEPFGLVMIEALACGTPVLSFPAGAAPEIVDHGRTGFLCRDVDEMTAMLGRVGQLDRRSCRQAVSARFSVSRMVDAHVDLYHRILGDRHVIDLVADRPQNPFPIEQSRSA